MVLIDWPTSCQLYAATKITIYLLIDVLHATAWENLSSVFMTRSNTNWTVQPHQMAGVIKLRIKVEMNFTIHAEKAGTDKLHDYRTADLRLYKTHDEALTKRNDLSNLCTILRQKKVGLIFLTH